MIPDIENPNIVAFLRICSESAINVEDASLAAGLPPIAVTVSLENGRLEDERINSGQRVRKTYANHLIFWRAYGKARAEARVNALKIIAGHTHDDWKASKFLIETMDANAYGIDAVDSVYFMGGKK